MYNNQMQKRTCCSCNNKTGNSNLENMIDDTCECGFDDLTSVFPENPMLAQSYVPWQVMDKSFVPPIGLKMGTVFPELVSPYMPGDSMKQIEYIKRNNGERGVTNNG